MSIHVVKFGGWTAWATAHLALVSMVAVSWMSAVLPAAVAQEAPAQQTPVPETPAKVTEAVPDSAATPAAVVPAPTQPASAQPSNQATFEDNPLKYQTTSSAPGTAQPAVPGSPSAVPASANADVNVPLADPEGIHIDPVWHGTRPDWIGKFSFVKGQPVGKQIAIASGPFATEAEARQELFNKAREATDRYIEGTVGSSQAPLLLGYSGEYVKSRFVNPKYEYVETGTFSFGPMKQVHALVQFTPDFDHDVQHRWRQIRSASRVGVVALVGTVALGMLLTFFGYLRADTSTRGYYTTRLKLAAGGVILAIVVAGMMGSRWVHWL